MMFFDAQGNLATNPAFGSKINNQINHSAMSGQPSFIICMEDGDAYAEGCVPIEVEGKIVGAIASRDTNVSDSNKKISEVTEKEKNNGRTGTCFAPYSEFIKSDEITGFRCKQKIS